MIHVTLEQLYGWMTAFLWPLPRVLALIGTAPLFGESGVPVKVKVGLGVLITIAVAPSVGSVPDVAPDSFSSFLILGQQIIIGIAMGLTIKMVFSAVQIAGEFIGLQMGLSFASFFDPGTGANTSVLSRFFNVIALLVFLALDGHLLILAGLVYSFEVLPITTEPFSRDGLGVLIEWSSEIFTLGLVLALPLITALLTMNLAMGILNRTAPQLSVFAVGFPLSLLAGLLMLTIVLPQTTPFLERLFSNGFETLAQLVTHSSPISR